MTVDCHRPEGGEAAVLPTGAHHMFLFVNAAGAAPVGYPMTGFFDRDTISFTTYRAARKVHRLLADDRVCCLVTPCSTAPRSSTALAVRGRARLEPDRRSLTPDGDFGGQGDIGPVPAVVRAKVAARLDSGKRVVFIVVIEDVQVVSAAKELTCLVEISV
jgi:hypothetical protein